jgi:hypothetical protein
MIIKVRNHHQPELWFTKGGVTEFERREFILLPEDAVPHYDRDFAAVDTVPTCGFLVQTVTVNYGPNPGESWTFLARLGSVYVMNDDGRTIEHF